MPKITDEPADEKFGIRFRTAWLQSKLRDLNQKELSQKFGYSQQGMSFIANGHRYPHLSTGLKIAKEFNCSMDWLYTGRDPMRPWEITPFTKIGERLMHLTHNQVEVLGWLIGLFEGNQINAEDLQDSIRRQHRVDLASLVTFDNRGF